MMDGVRWRIPRAKAIVDHLEISGSTMGQDRERHLLQNGLAHPKKEVPTLEVFAAKFLDGYAKANRQKPSGIAANETIIRVHLVPLLGKRKLYKAAAARSALVSEAGRTPPASGAAVEES
jgi:hypothetical protein